MPPAEVATEPGIVLHRASGRRLSYGQVAGLPRLVTDVPEITDADLKPRSAYRLIGTDPGRRDIPGKTRGETTYSIDVRLPGMSYAALLLAPVEGETPVRIGDRAARAVPGVIDIVPLRNAVAVVAERWESALRARDMLDVEWTATSHFRDADSATDLAMEVAIARDLARTGTDWETRGERRGSARRVRP